MMASDGMRSTRQSDAHHVELVALRVVLAVQANLRERGQQGFNRSWDRLD